MQFLGNFGHPIKIALFPSSSIECGQCSLLSLLTSNLFIDLKFNYAYNNN